MPASPYDLKVSFSPLRMRKGDDKPVQMNVIVKNLEADQNLTSVLIEIPGSVGFDRTGFVNRKELRIGKMEPGEEKSITIDLFTNAKSEPGSHIVKVTANKHYRGYSHILENSKKETTVRIV